MKYNALIVGLALMLPVQNVMAQRPGGVAVDSWEVNVRQMPADVREEITETMSRLNGTEDDRGIIAEVGKAVGFGLISSLVDVVVTETFNLAQYRKKQKGSG